MTWEEAVVAFARGDVVSTPEGAAVIGAMFATVTSRAAAQCQHSRRGEALVRFADHSTLWCRIADLKARAL